MKNKFKGIKILAILGIAIFTTFSLSGCFNKKDVDNNQTKNNPVVKENINKQKVSNNKVDSIKKEIPEDKVVDTGKEFSKVISISNKNLKTNNVDTKEVRIYHKGLNTAIIYGEEQVGPIPGSTVKSTYQIGQDAYTCLEINNKKNCILAKDTNTHLIEFFDFDSFIDIIKKNGKVKSNKETIKGEDMDCFTQTEGEKMEKVCSVNGMFKYGINKNGENMLESQLISHNDTVEDGFFKLPFDVITLEEFKNQNKEIFENMEKEQKMKEEAVKKIIEEQAKQNKDKQNQEAEEKAGETEAVTVNE